MKFPVGSTDGTIGQIVAGTGTSGSSASQLNTPRFVVVDRNGTLFISDGSKRKFKKNNRTCKILFCSSILDNNRIQRWFPNATSGDTVVGGTLGTGPTQLSFPEGILFDENHNMIVADRGNNRIQFFNITRC